MHSEHLYQIERHKLRKVTKRSFPHERNIPLLTGARKEDAAGQAKEECSGWLGNNTATQSAIKPSVTGRASRESEDCTFSCAYLIFTSLCLTIDLAISLICISPLSLCSSSRSQFFLNKIETPSIDLDGIIILLLLKSPSIYSKNEAFLIHFMQSEACLERNPEISAVVLDKVKSLGDT